MAHSSVSVSFTQDKHRQAIRNLLYYETEQIRQELTRKSLGYPYGRAPPPKLPKLTSVLHRNLSSVASVRPLSTKKDVEGFHRTCMSEAMPSITELTTIEPQFLSPVVDRFSTMSFQQEALGMSISRKSSTLPFAALSPSLTPEPFFESDGFSNPFERPNGKHYFFPLEMFMDWSEIPTFPCDGFYLHPVANDCSEWRRCTILSHDSTTRKFEISLPHSTAKRLIPRKRLRFSLESEKQFSDLIELAHTLRKSHEGFVRYFARFEIAVSQGRLGKSMEFEESQGEIFRKIGIRISEEAIGQVRDELWDLYRRSVTKFIFDTQYFAPKAELMLCPWKFDLHRQERWRTLITSTNLKSYPYKSSKRSVEEQLSNKGKTLQLTRLIVYQQLTRLRWGDYYSCLREFRKFQTKMNFFELKNEFRAKFAKDTLKIDTMVKQLSDQIFKVLEPSPSLLPEVESFLQESEYVLESNLQFAVTRSIRLLIDIFQEYYAILPIPGDLTNRFKQLPAYLVRRHNGETGVDAGKHISELQSIAIVKEMIGLLYTGLTANRLFVYSLISAPLPLLTISIESKLTRERMQEGRKPEYFALGEIKWETGVRRSKASRLKASSRIEISDAIKVNKVIRNILQLTDECLSSDEEQPSAHYLLDEVIFGWVSAGKDKMIVDLNPKIPEIDSALQKLLKAPLKNILRIKKFALKPTETDRVRVRNASHEIKTALRAIADVFQFSMYGPVALVALLREFDYLFSKKLNDVFFNLVKAHIEDYPGLISEIRTIFKHKDMLENRLPDCMQFGFFLVRLTILKTEAKRNSEVLIEALITELTNEHLAILTDITTEFHSLLAKLSVVPQSVEDLDDMIQFLDAKEDEKVMAGIKKELKKVAIIEDSLDEFHWSISNEQSSMTWKTKSWESQLSKEKQRLTRRIQRLMPTFQEQVRGQVDSLKSAIFTMKADMAEFVTYSDVQNADQYAARATDVLDRLQKLKREVGLANFREKVLKLDKTDFLELLSMEEQFLSFHTFWNYASEWSSAYLSWMEKPLHFIDPDVVESRFSKGLKLMDRMKEEMANNLNVMRAVQEQDEMLRSFEHSIPLIYSLRQDSLRDRHWKKIWDLLGRSTNDRSDGERKTMQTLRELLVKGILKRTKEVESIANEAKNEFEIEKIWTKIDKDLKIPNVHLVPHSKHAELHVISKLDEVKDRLHEYLTTVIYLTKANRHIDPFRDQLRMLEQMIGTQQAIVEDLHEFQELLCEMYPIFKISEVCEQLPRTAVRMNELVDYYSQQLAFIESVTHRQNNTFTIRTEAKFTYPEASAELKKVREDVRMKIAEKQELCSRLYFLSDLQILELLHSVNSEGKIAVSQLFPGIEDVEIEDQSIIGIFRLGSHSRLSKPVSVRNGSHTRSLEEWISDLDRSLRDQHSLNIQESFKSFSSSGLFWSKIPDHEVVYTSYLMWVSKRVQRVICETATRQKLEVLIEELKLVLEDGIRQMRPKSLRPQESLKFELFGLAGTQVEKPHRPNECFAHLLIMHIDFIQKMLEASDGDFQLIWKTALKVREVSTGLDSFSLYMDCFDYTTAFGFETHSSDFMNSVILTPITERFSLHIYLTLKHSMGCLVLGDTGSDKTETIRFLAIVCGKVFQTISVTSITPFERLVKFLIGCATGGFWGCFDEVHALPPIHLSTLAKYTQMVINALSPVLTRITIDAYIVKPKPGFAIFCTRGSGGAEIPLSVRETFRCISVSKPDLSITATILLQTSGIARPRKYGILIARAIEELSQPILALSTGDALRLHHRADHQTLVRVIKALVAMERDNFIDDVEYMINNAFRQVYGLGLPTIDLAILDECLCTLFQSLHNDKLSQLAVRGGVADLIAKMAAVERVAKPEMLQKRALQLFSLMNAADWPWVFVIGPANCGKSTTISLVAKAAAAANNASFRVHRLGAVLSQESLIKLYEHLECVTSDWFSPSFLGSYCSQAVGNQAKKYSGQDWVLVDGFKVPYTAEVLFSLTKSHPKSSIKLIFEAENLSTLDPALVSEAGLLHLEKTEIDSFDYYMTTVAKICGDDMAALLPGMEELYYMLMLPSLKLMEAVEQTMKVDSKFLIEMFSHLLKPYLALLRKKAKLEESLKAIPLNLTKASLVLIKRSNTVAPPRLPIEDRRKETVTPQVLMKMDVLKGVGSIRKASKVKPQNTLEAVFIVSLLNSFSNFLINTDSFSNLLLDIIKKQPEAFAGFLHKEYGVLKARSLLEMIFSVKHMNWTLLVSAFSSKHQSMNRTGGRKGPATQKPELSLSYLESITCRYDNFDGHRDEFLVPTASTQRLSFWVEFCYRNKVDIVVFGPHQSGKSSVTMAVAKELLGLSFSGLIPMNISSHMDCSVVQDLIENSMESRRKREFGGVGGAHFYAILDDMSLDPSNQIYDMFRFWRETSGWYSDGFTGIDDLTVAFVHSYVEGKSRGMWLRAMRHFLMVNKPGYSQVELTSIFRKHIDNGLNSEDPESEGMLSVAEESIRFLVSLFNDLSLQHGKTEQMWCQMAISNFSQALKFLAQFQLDEDMDIPQYLKLWTFTFSRFFLDQFGSVSSPIKAILIDNLKSFVEKFTDSDQEATSIYLEGVLIPIEEQIRQESSTPFTAFDIICEDSLETLITVFRESRMHAAKLYPHRLKHLNSLLFDVEHRLSAYISFYLGTIYDINSPCPSVIVRTSNQPGLVKALIYMAANTMKVKIFEFNGEEKEDVFAGTLMENFKSFSASYFPTEPRFEVKKIMEETMMNDKRVVVVFTLAENQLERPLNRRFMEIALDILTGVKLRLSGFSNYYKDFIEKYRNSSPALSQLYNDEVLQLMLDRMKSNVTIMFIIAASADSWTRSPLHPVRVMEQFKHEYRTIFNKSRVVDFDHMRPLPMIVDIVRSNEVFIDEWRLDCNVDIYREIGEKLETLDCGITCDEYTYECVVHCSRTLMKAVADRRNNKRALLTKALSQVQMIQKEIRHSEKRLIELKVRLELVRSKLEKVKSKLANAKQRLVDGLAHPYEVELANDIENRRAEIASELESAKLAWENAIDFCTAGIEELAETDKLTGNPSATKVVYLLYLLVSQQKSDAQGEKTDSIVRKFVQQVGKKWKEMGKKLKHLPGEAIPDLSTLLESPEITPNSRTSKPIRSVIDLLTSSSSYKLSCRRFLDASDCLDSELHSIPTRVAGIKLALEARETQIQGKLAQKTDLLEAKITDTQRQIDYIIDKKPDLLDLVQNLQGTKEAWTAALSSFDEDEASALSECILAGFFIVKGVKFSSSQRQLVWKSISKVLGKRGYACQDSESLTPRLLSDFPQFAYECVHFELTDSGFFLESAAFLRLIIEANLPFPLIFDPFDVAYNYLARLEESNNVLIGKVSSDPEFERKFKECVVEGRPVLIQNPSLSLYKAVFSAVVWKAQKFLMELRGMDTTGFTMKIMQKSVDVHPSFRVYICHSDPPPSVISSQATEISFDAEDRESWEGLLVVPLLKTLDDSQYFHYVSLDVQTAQTRIILRDRENSFLTDVIECDPKQILVSQEMEEKLSVESKKIEFGKKGMRRVSTLELAGGLRDANSSLGSLTEEVIGPREKLVRVLEEFYEMKTVLDTLEPSLDDFYISGKTLYLFILKSLHEYIAAISVPMANQWEELAESLVYNVFVRILHSMSREKRAIFASVYALFKTYSKEQVQRGEFFQVLEDIIRLNTQPPDEESIAYLRSRYPSLFPSHFSPGSATFKLFLTRDLFSDAKLPDHFSSLSKFLLYAYLRPDLLSGFSARIMREVMGPRYAWVPDMDLDLHIKDVSKMPMVVFFESTSPLLYLRPLADIRKIPLIATQPIMTSVIKTGKTEMRGIGRFSETILTTIGSHLGMARWVAVENLPIITGLEAEVVTKFLLTKTGENVNEAFRIFVLFPGRPKDYPEWSKLIRHSQRIVLPEPSTIKDIMTQWHSISDINFFIKFQETQHQLFWSNCALGPIHITEKFPGKKDTSRKKSIEITEDDAVEATATPTKDPKTSPKTEFSTALLCAVVHLRNQYSPDLTTLWHPVDTQRILSDFLESLPPMSSVSQIIKPGALAIFSFLLAPQAGHFAHAAFVSLSQQLFAEDRSSMLIRSREGVAKLNTIEYPLYTLEKTDRAANLSALISRYPSEDHLFLTGLSHCLAAAKSNTLISPLLAAVAAMPLTITDSNFYIHTAKRISLAAEKERIVEFLQRTIGELIAALPEPKKSGHRRGREVCENHGIKKPKDWFVKEKSPGRVRKEDIDLRNAILDENRSLREIIEIIKTAEQHRRRQFLTHVRKPLIEMLRYLNYSRSILIPEEMALLCLVATHKVPKRWIELSPFTAKQTITIEDWKRQVINCFNKDICGETIDLTALFAPDLALKTILRAFAIAQRKKADDASKRCQTTLEVDFEDTEFAAHGKADRIKTPGFEKMGFSASFSQQADPSLYQFSISGLCVTNARINPETNLLEDYDQTTPLPPMTLSPIVLPKDIRSNPAYPAGIKIVLLGGDGGLTWDAVATINGMMWELPDYMKPKKKRNGTELMVYCPVRIAEQGDVWFLTSSKDPQGYWSKRGISISLLS